MSNTKKGRKTFMTVIREHFGKTDVFPELEAIASAAVAANGGLVSVEVIADAIGKETGVSVSVQTLRNTLRRFGRGKIRKGTTLHAAITLKRGPREGTNTKNMGRKTVMSKLQEHFGEKDIFPELEKIASEAVEENDGEVTMEAVHSAIVAATGIEVCPAALRQSLRRYGVGKIKKGTTLKAVLSIGRGRPAAVTA